jgi:hypothetical protein
MKYDEEKFKALVLYVIWRTSHMSGFGSTKLNKVLWFSEARSFESLGAPIAGEEFVKDQFGPRSSHLRGVCSELEEAGLVEPFVEQVFSYNATRFRAHQPPDTSAFTAQQLSLIDWWISDIAEKHTATSISDLSHDYGWEVARMGEKLPLTAFLAKRIRNPKSLNEIEWAQKEAQKLGLE